MAGIVWTDPALDQLQEIVEYMAQDKPEAASSFMKRALSTVDQLEVFPEYGHVPPELANSIYRELSVKPCRIFYRQENEVVLVIHVMREEMQMRKLLLDTGLDS